MSVAANNFEKERKRAFAALARPILEFEPDLVAEKLAAERKAKEETMATAIANAQPGQMVEGQGIFIGRYQPKDSAGNSLSRIFNVFAAPEDLVDLSTQEKLFQYIEAVACIKSLRGWHGFDGGAYANATAFYEALKNSSYSGQWIIPPLDILCGIDSDGNITQRDNLYANKDHGALAGSFVTLPGDAGAHFKSPSLYWSSTIHSKILPTVWAAHFFDSSTQSRQQNLYRLSCRPVRLVPV